MSTKNLIKTATIAALLLVTACAHTELKAPCFAIGSDVPCEKAEPINSAL